MINFTVGPVQMNYEIKKIGAEDIPYFRTNEFSNLILENERMICELAKAGKESRALFLTTSGTGAMEATILNCFDEKDLLLIINGGSFGQRFVDICTILNIKFIELKLEYGENLNEKKLEKYLNLGITGMLINIHETSTGVLYDLNLISNFCKKENIFLVVDAISSFISDKIEFENSKIDVMIIGSQKALALPPGLSIIMLSKFAVQKIEKKEVRSLYFDLKKALVEGERGQTPFTPAVSILIQLNKRLKKILEIGIETERKRIEELALNFRDEIRKIQIDIFSENMSNTLTALKIKNAYSIFEILKNEYNIWICPNGGDLKNKIVRVGHIGNLTKNDNMILIKALKDLKRRRILK